MKLNEGRLDKPRNQMSCEAIQEIQGMGADYLLTSNEDDLCERLVTKYQSHFSVQGVGREQSAERQSLADTIRQNLSKRKANLFGGLTSRRRTAAGGKSDA